MDSLRVWVNDKPVGWLSRHGRGTTFSYDRGVDEADAISLLMPIQAGSFDTFRGLLPIFDSNLPEGDLYQRIHKVLAKDRSGRVDDFDVLAVTGGNQIGRIRLLPEGVSVERREIIGQIDAYLHSRTNPEMINALIDRYALRSGVSGAMPKFLATTCERKTTVQCRDWIFKFDAADYPGLSLNEFHCMQAARAAGNRTAQCEISDDGLMLAVRRFDSDGDDRLGFEDMASINAKTSDQKYEGSVETALFKRLAAFSAENTQSNLSDLYRSLLTTYALRNGDAHLKNFGILYPDAMVGPFTLAPAYDIVTTVAFDVLRDDRPALTIKGRKTWPRKDDLLELANRAQLRPHEAQSIMDEVADGIRATIPAMVDDLVTRGHTELARRMLAAWNDGLEHTLGAQPVLIEITDTPKSPVAQVSAETDLGI